MEALLKMKSLIESADICMITNSILEWPLKNESLRNQWIDTEGNIWFLFIVKDKSGINYTDGNMEVFYSDKARSKFLSLVGTARISSRNELPDASRLAHKGIDVNKSIDTPLQIVKFSPLEAYVWDDHTKDMVPFTLPRNAVLN